MHVGTGNYNPATARIYEDIGLLTSDAKLGAEVSDLFNYLTGFSRNKRYRTMMVAPHGMRKRMIRLIEREVRHSSAEAPGRIAMKLNSLVDPQVIDALYRASQQGVKVDLVIRGICSLRPGVPGLSENIRVRSILGRFLEHSRIYYFGKGGEREVYIGSADMMQRNLNGRVEALAKVKAPELKKQLKGLDRPGSRGQRLVVVARRRRALEPHPAGARRAARSNYQEVLMRRASGDDA